MRWTKLMKYAAWYEQYIFSILGQHYEPTEGYTPMCVSNYLKISITQQTTNFTVKTAAERRFHKNAEYGSGNHFMDIVRWDTCFWE